MKHVLVGLEGTQVTLHTSDSPPTPVTMTSSVGSDYAAPFDAVEYRFFNSQYGWLPEGILVLPAGAEIWMKRTGIASPGDATLAVYEGGMGNTMATWTMRELYVSDGDIWKWDRLMQHDVYVADQPGDYAMSFEVYVGDAITGVALSQYGSAETTLSFRTPVPEPSTALLTLAAAMIAFAGWRRSKRTS